MKPAARDKFVIEVHSRLPASWPNGADLGETRGYVFQTAEFIRSWTATYGSDEALTPLYVEVRERDGSRLLLLPLCLTRRGWLTTLSFIDNGHADYNAAIVYPAAAGHAELFTRAFWESLFNQLPHFDLARLDKLPEQVDDLSNPVFALADTDNDAAAHGGSLEGAWETVETRSFQSPKEMRKKQRQLERLGPVRLVMGDDPARRQLLLERLIEQKQRRFEETHVAGFAENPQSLAFLRRATTLFAESGQLILCGLAVGDEITAVQWGLALNGRFYALVTGFEAGDWAKFSCGRVLHHHLLKWLHDEGFSYFDQGVGDEPYKLENSSITVPLRRAIIVRSARGRLHLARLAVVARLKATSLGERARRLRWIAARALRRRLRRADPP